MISGISTGVKKRGHDLADLHDAAGHVVARSPQHVDVHRRPDFRGSPDSQHQGPLEDESPGMGEAREAVQKPLPGHNTEAVR